MLKQFIAIYFYAHLCYSATPVQGLVKLDDLVKRNDLYYLSGKESPFTGKAYSFYSKGKIQDEFTIEKGICVRYNNFSEKGQLLLSAGYTLDRKKDGKYLECNNRGDTLQFGIFINGKKDGKWVETENGEKGIGHYKNGYKSGKWIINKEGEAPHEQWYKN